MSKTSPTSLWESLKVNFQQPNHSIQATLQAFRVSKSPFSNSYDTNPFAISYPAGLCLWPATFNFEQDNMAHPRNPFGDDKEEEIVDWNQNRRQIYQLQQDVIDMIPKYDTLIGDTKQPDRRQLRQTQLREKKGFGG